MKSILDRLRSRRREETGVSDVPDALLSERPRILGTLFDLDFFKKIWELGPQQNICVSPFSVESVLALLHGGAEGETRRAIGQVLGGGEVATEELDRDYTGLLDSWRKCSLGRDIQISIANSVWTGRGFPIGKEFARRAKEYYDAATGELDFDRSPERTVRAINDWVKEKTRSKIPSLLDTIPPATRLVLASAVYFKGLWGEDAKFDRRLTKNETFHLLDGSDKRVPMMRHPKKRELPYYRGEGFQSVILPYVEDDLGLVLFLPDERGGLGEFLRGLNAENWAKWVTEFMSIPGDVVLPRFKLEYSIGLTGVLSALGMGVAFGSGADFSGLSAEPLWIGEARHKALLEVNEEGSEAAAGTAMVMRLGLKLPPAKEFKMVLDHPFFCAVMNRRNNSILFAAAVVDPS